MKELNIVNIVPKERHPLIFSTFDGLAAGESFVLVDNHDPTPFTANF